MNQVVDCPVCGQADCSKISLASKSKPFPVGPCYDCERCGSFILPDEYGQLRDLTPLQRGVLSHRLRRMQRNNAPPPEVSESVLPKPEEPLPSPAEQADRLILWIGGHQPSPAQAIEMVRPEISAWIGTAITPNDARVLEWLLRQPQLKALVEMYAASKLLLTFAGWRRYEELTRAEVESRTAFMAMKFDDEMDRMVKSYFKPAVAQTGFELRLLTDRQPAGLIDDQLRVALRTSRFVIADLTHANNGAYWEAGFAEGLGRPVIYTCRKKEWNERKTHFDTNHLNTIDWDPDKLHDAARRLTAMIRATLPAEAKLTD
jgi:nucleoside 2-deoxyribosyltransferase